MVCKWPSVPVNKRSEPMRSSDLSWCIFDRICEDGRRLDRVYRTTKFSYVTVVIQTVRACSDVAHVVLEDAQKTGKCSKQGRYIHKSTVTGKKAVRSTSTLNGDT